MIYFPSLTELDLYFYLFFPQGEFNLSLYFDIFWLRFSFGLVCFIFSLQAIVQNRCMARSWKEEY